MNRYELVAIIDPRMQKDDIVSTISEIESIIGNLIIDKDDIWMLDLSYPIKWNDRAYFLSLFIEGDNDLLKKIDEKLRLMKSVIRFHIYAMRQNDKFLKYAEVNKQFEESQNSAE